MGKQPARKGLVALTPLEQGVMAAVWRLGECTSAQVIAAYREERSLADTTVRTVLANLRKKGYVEVIPTVDRQYLFRPAVAQEAVARRLLHEFVQRLFAGSRREAIAQLIAHEDVDEAELREIRKLIEARKKEGKKR